MLRSLLVAFFTIFSTSIYAHPGHDHNHWLSGLTHAVLILSIVGVLFTAVQFFRSKKQVNKEDK